MTLTITLSQATLGALAEEASSRNTTCEKVVSEMVEDYFTPVRNNDPDYDAWFKAKYEEGMAAYRAGQVHTHAEVQEMMKERKEIYLSRIAGNR